MAGRVAGRAAGGDEQRRRAHGDGLVGQGRRPVEVGQRARSRSAAAAGPPSRTRPCPGCGRGPRRTASSRSPPCSQSRSRRLWNVLNTSWLEKPSRSSARGRSSAMNEPVAAKFLRLHDLARPRRPGSRRSACVARSRSKAASRSRCCSAGIAGLAQLVAARVAQRLDAVADAGVGVVPQPRRGLHDVGVGVVDHPPRRVVRHGARLAQPRAGCPSARATPPGRRSWPRPGAGAGGHGDGVEVDDAVGDGPDRLLVAGHDDRAAGRRRRCAGRRAPAAAWPGVLVAGRLVGQEERRPGDDGAGDGEALLLAERGLGGRTAGQRARGRARPSTSAASRAGLGAATLRPAAGPAPRSRPRTARPAGSAPAARSRSGPSGATPPCSAHGPTRSMVPASGSHHPTSRARKVLFPLPDRPRTMHDLARVGAEGQRRQARWPRPSAWPGRGPSTRGDGPRWAAALTETRRPWSSSTTVVGGRDHLSIVAGHHQRDAAIGGRAEDLDDQPCAVPIERGRRLVGHDERGGRRRGRRRSPGAAARRPRAGAPACRPLRPARPRPSSSSRVRAARRRRAAGEPTRPGCPPASSRSSRLSLGCGSTMPIQLPAEVPALAGG